MRSPRPRLAEVDLDRSIANVFGVGDTTWSKVVNNTTFHVTRSTDWVSTNNSTVACGAGGRGEPSSTSA